MDSIRHSGFQPSAQVRQQGVPQRQDEEDGSQGDHRSSDGFCESLLPEDELDQEEEQAEGERHEQELLEKYPLWENEQAGLLLEEVFVKQIHLCVLLTDFHSRHTISSHTGMKKMICIFGRV